MNCMYVRYSRLTSNTNAMVDTLCEMVAYYERASILSV